MITGFSRDFLKTFLFDFNANNEIFVVLQESMIIS